MCYAIVLILCIRAQLPHPGTNSYFSLCLLEYDKPIHLVAALKYGDIAELEGSIDAAYIGTSQRLLHLLSTKFKLVDHLTAIKRYILLGQGDFIQHLMESLG